MEGYEPLPDLCAGEPPSDGDENGGNGGDGDDETGDGEGGGGGEPELRIPEFTAYTVLTDDALAPECIVREGAQSWDSLDSASKRLFVRIEGFPSCGDDE